MRPSTVLPGILALLLAGGAGWLSFDTLLGNGAQADLLRGGSRIESNLGAVSVDSIRRQAERAALHDPETDRCRPSVEAAGALVVNADVATRNEATDYDGWLAAGQRAQTVLRRAIACSPQDGALWTRLALVEREGVFVPRRLGTLLSLSWELAPADPGPLAGRAGVWRTGPVEPLGADEARHEDIATILAYAFTGDAVRLLAHAAPPVDGEVLEQAEALDPRRREALDRVGLFGRKAHAPVRPGSLGELLFAPRGEKGDAFRGQPSGGQPSGQIGPGVDP